MAGGAGQTADGKKKAKGERQKAKGKKRNISQ